MQFRYKVHKIVLFLILFLVACSVPASPETPATTASPVPRPASTSGGFDKWTLWTDGTQLRGANIYQRRVYPDLDGRIFLGPGPLGPPYTQADFDALAAAGANYVNLSVPGVFTVQPPYQVDEDVVAMLDEMIAMAAQADLFVVISARTGPGRSEFSILRDGAGDWFDASYLIESVWEDEAARQAWAEMWRYTAARYRDNPVVVGYDLMVEPNSNDILGIYDADEFARRYGGSGYDWNAWYPDLVRAIRSVDADTPVLVGGLGYSALSWLPALQPVDAPRVVYTFHQYEPFVYTHQEAETGLMNTYPGFFDADWDESPEEVNRDWLAEYLGQAEDFSQQYGVPVAVNECGLMRWEPGAADFMRDQLALYEQMGLNVAVWMWYPSWPELAVPDGDHAFNFRFGPSPQNLQDTPNDLWQVYQAFWQKSSLRPGDWR